MFHTALWVLAICNLIGIWLAFLKLPPPGNKKDRLFQKTIVEGEVAGDDNLAGARVDLSQRA